MNSSAISTNCNYLMSLKKQFAPFLQFLVLFFFIPPEIHSQNLIQDSLQLNFENDLLKSIPFPIKIDTVFDCRDVPHSHLIGIDEVNKYVFVPVDLHLVTSRPFADVVLEALPGAAPGAKSHLSLGIHHFDVSNRAGFLFKRYQIRALVCLYQLAARIWE